jgi:hypothetical protein
MISIILFLLFIWFILLITPEKTESESRKVIGECPPHKWEYEKQPDNPELEYLRCKNCGKFPGYDPKEGL